ncbi:hypothetical protein BDR07DRAFT_1483497 [Suillus spraguei]|nr:hypothetical protein BDR07DRAFT_1483497 [Suillus spraguei]
MSFHSDTSSASAPTILHDYTFKSDLLTDERHWNNELKYCVKAVLQETGPTLTSVHGVKTSNILDAMMEGSEKAGLLSGLRYAAAAIIMAYEKGKTFNSSASELTKTVKKPYRVAYSPKSEISTPFLHASEPIVDHDVPATSQGSRSRNLISEREDDKRAVTGT